MGLSRPLSSGSFVPDAWSVTELADGELDSFRRLLGGLSGSGETMFTRKECAFAGCLAKV